MAFTSDELKEMKTMISQVGGPVAHIVEVLLDTYQECSTNYGTLIDQHKELLEAVIDLYYMGKWECDKLDEDQQRKIWERVRDAAGIEPGEATKYSIGA